MFDFQCSSQKLHLILDCDDVLLDWLGGFRNWLLNGMHVDGEPDPAGPTDWNMSQWLGLTSEQCLMRVAEFNASEHFGLLDARYDALLALPAFHWMGHKLTVLTSCADDPVTVERRKGNLSYHFGEIFDQVICLPLGASKREHLQKFDRGIWIEDNYGHGLAGHACGHRTFMLRRRHNRMHERSGDSAITWIDDLRPIVSLLS